MNAQNILICQVLSSSIPRNLLWSMVCNAVLLTGIK